MLSDQNLEAILIRRFSPDHKVREIIRQARAAGGFDNITVALAWK
jgi:serine/threonine protein phosphatase PrpC